MSTSFYDLLKYAATGQASPGMTYYDRMRASALMGGAVQTLTGIPPLDFISKTDKTLISWSMLGNGQQTGTPSPQNIIMPTFCGVRTNNLAKYWKAALVSASGSVNESNVNGASFPVKIEAGQTVCFSNQKTNFGRGIAVFSGFNGETLTGMIYRSTNSTVTYTADSDCYVIIWGNYDNKTSMDEAAFSLCGQMLNYGSTALPYEPYGYKIPITCAGQTTQVYLGEVPTVRRVRKLVLTGTEQCFVYNYNSKRGFKLTGLDGKYTRAQGICTHYPVYSGTSYNDCLWLGVNDSTIYFVDIGTNMGITEPEEFQSYLAAQYAAGTPVTIWYVLANEQTGIVNEPLCKIGDYADELSSTDAAVTIPTAKGQNTLTVDTPIQPSEMTITYKE